MVVGCGADVVREDVPPEFRNERSVELVGLGEHVRLVKTPQHAWVEFADGHHEPMTSVLAREKAAARERFGILHPRLRAALAARAYPDTAPVRVAAKFSRLPTVEETEFLAQAVEDELRAAGLEVTGRAKVATLVFAQGSPDALNQMSRSPLLEAVYLDEAVDVAATSGNAAPFTRADTTMWPEGVTGGTQRIGYIEAIPQHVETFSEHGAFYRDPPKWTSVIHAWAGPTCKTQADCDAICPVPQTHGCRCQYDRCVGEHATSVAGVLAQVAPEADLVMANAAGLNPLTFAGLDSAYAAIKMYAGVDIVNQSFQANASGVQGIVENDVARAYDKLVVQAAGNLGYDSGSHSTACRDNPSALCVGSHGQNYQPSCFSNWKNPVDFDISTDREEPDVLGFGGDGGACDAPDEYVYTASPASEWAYGHRRGTSYAAPAAAASAALLTECVEMHGGEIGGLGLRAAFMALATRNSVDFRYSTAKGTTSGGPDDWRDGAGILTLHSCESIAGGPWIFGEVPIDLSGGTDTPPPPPGSPEIPEYPPLAQNVPYEPGDGRLTHVLWEFQGSSTMRVRWVVSWNVCDVAPPNAVYRAVPDFDLFLFNQTKGHVVFASMSFDDNNEGFDVHLGHMPGNDDGDIYEIRLANRTNGSYASCPDSPGSERVAYAGGAWAEP